MKLPSIEEMLGAGMHFGHQKSKWHPKMEPFIFGQRNGVHIIDLTKTEKMFKTALEFIEKFASEGKMILLVGTKMQVKGPLKTMAEDTGMPYVTEKWMGGTLTNFSVVKRLIKKYMDIIRDKETGELGKYTKKERLGFDRELGRLTIKVGGLTKLTRLPDAVFVWDIKTEKTAVLEAKKKNIPIIAICDTNVDPTGINYIIPSNDDATKTIKLVLETMKTAFIHGQAEKAQNSVSK